MSVFTREDDADLKARAEAIQKQMVESIQDLHPSGRNTLAAILGDKADDLMIEAAKPEYQSRPAIMANLLGAARAMIRLQFIALKANDDYFATPEEEVEAAVKPVVFLLNQLSVLPATQGYTPEQREAAVADPEAFYESIEAEFRERADESVEAPAASTGMYL